MGALTLKSFPFELRGWDLTQFKSFDPTDGFSSKINIYIHKNQIVQVEPAYDYYFARNWLTDRGRHFFDGIYGKWELYKENTYNYLNKKSWIQIIKNIVLNIYFYDYSYCLNNFNKKKFIILFESVSTEVISLLMLLKSKFSFLELKKSYDSNLPCNIESNFQLNVINLNSKWNFATTCLLVSNNPRYEGYYLNLNLKQRIVKGNFECFVIGSLVNLTFPISFLGSNLKALKTIIEGTNLKCQNFKLAKNPFIIFNSEFFKRNDSSVFLNIIQILKKAKIFSHNWYGINVFNPTLTETGILSSNNYMSLNLKDVKNFNFLYLINLGVNNLFNIKKVLETKVLNFNKSNKSIKKKVILDQNVYKNINMLLSFKLLSENYNKNCYYYLPTTTFYENHETFINTEGTYVQTTKLIFQKKTRNNWQILRRFFKHIKKKINFVSNIKDNTIVFFNSKQFKTFQNYINFHFYGVQNLTHIKLNLDKKSQLFSVHHNKSHKFKQKIIKIYNTKLNYWLNDFFNGGRDEYSFNSVVLKKYSEHIRLETTNFF